MTKKTDVLESIILGSIICLSGILRFFAIYNRPLNLDEFKAVIYGNMPFFKLFALNIKSHPPLYYVINRLFILVLGDNDFTVRFIVILAGILTVYMTYLIGRYLFSRNVGFVASFLMAISLYHIEYSVQVRSYSVVALFASVGVYCFFRYVDSKRLLFLAGYTVSMLLLAYTHYFAVLVLCTMILYSFVDSKCRSLLKYIIAAHIFIFLGYIPQMQEAFGQIVCNKGVQVKHTLSLASILLVVPKNIVGTFYRLGYGYVILDVKSIFESIRVFVSFIIPFLIFVLGLWAVFKNARRKLIFICIFFMMPLVLLSFHVVGNPQRFMMMQIPFYFITIAAGIVYLWEKILIKSLLVGYLAINVAGLWCLYAPSYTYLITDYKKSADIISKNTSDNDVVYLAEFVGDKYQREMYVFSQHFLFRRYFKSDIPIVPFAIKYAKENIENFKSRVLEGIVLLLKKCDTVWLVYTDKIDDVLMDEITKDYSTNKFQLRNLSIIRVLRPKE